MNMRSPCICQIVPPRVLRKLMEETEDLALREALLDTIELSSHLRGQRQGRAENPPPTLAGPIGGLQRSIYDAGHGTRVPGRLIRAEGETGGDSTAQQAYDSAGTTYNFYKEVLKRNSVDDRGMPLLSSVHYGRSFNNAFWNAKQMIYGDGDGTLFLGFAGALDVVAHELTHGVTQYTVPGGLVYEGLSGALNESISDVFGSVVKQWAHKETVDQADWLIGSGILGPGLGKALRSMAQPGTAWIHDDQPGNMSDIDPSADVHTNSGVPNRAFYLAATNLGGRSWEKAAPIWYAALSKLKPNADFRAAREATSNAAEQLFGGAEKGAVQAAWDKVGVS